MKLVDFIVCDDIRREEGGKTTLVGMYNDKVRFYPNAPERVKWPQTKQIGVYCRLIGGKSDPIFQAGYQSYPLCNVTNVKCDHKLDWRLYLRH